ncbi:hypothetical protein pb186bvf_020180 [Paramecium bursaria]
MIKLKYPIILEVLFCQAYTTSICYSLYILYQDIGSSSRNYKIKKVMSQFLCYIIYYFLQTQIQDPFKQSDPFQSRSQLILLGFLLNFQLIQQIPKYQQPYI